MLVGVMGVTEPLPAWSLTLYRTSRDRTPKNAFGGGTSQSRRSWKGLDSLYRNFQLLIALVGEDRYLAGVLSCLLDA